MTSAIDTALKIFQIITLALLAALISGLLMWVVVNMSFCVFSPVLILMAACVVTVCGVTAYETWTSDGI